ncbi:TPA: internalin N-terminal domain-containing protein, partial [Listeria innocua]
MKINWKKVLVFVLILALISPVYSKAIETEQSISPEQPVEPVVEEAIKETPEKKETEPEPKKEPEPPKKEEIEPKKPSTEPSKLKANPSSIPENSTIADLFPDPVMAESVVRNLNYQIQYKKDWVVTDVITQADLDKLYSFTDLSTVIIKNLEGIQYMTN